LLGRLHKLEALATFAWEIYLQSLLKIGLRPCDDFDVRSEASITLEHDCYDDTHYDDLDILSDPSSPFASLLETSTPLDTSEDVPIVPDPSFPLAPLGEREEGDGFETNASLDDKCGILVESEDTFSEEHSLDEPYVEFSEVSPHIELNNLISDQSFPDIAPPSPFSPLPSPLPIFLPSLDPLASTFADSETFVFGNPCFDQTLDDIDIDRLEDHFEVKDLTLGHPLSFDFHISLD